jgi:hypothetical protein
MRYSNLNRETTKARAWSSSTGRRAQKKISTIKFYKADRGPFVPSARWNTKDALPTVPRYTPSTLEQEPDALLSLIDPVFKQARCCDIAVLVASSMHFSKFHNEAIVIVPQFRQHGLRFDIVCIIIEDALVPRNIAYRTQRTAANLPCSLRD